MGEVTKDAGGWTFARRHQCGVGRGMLHARYIDYPSPAMQRHGSQTFQIVKNQEQLDRSVGLRKGRKDISK